MIGRMEGAEEKSQHTNTKLSAASLYLFITRPIPSTASDSIETRELPLIPHLWPHVVSREIHREQAALFAQRAAFRVSQNGTFSLEEAAEQHGFARVMDLSDVTVLLGSGSSATCAAASTSVDVRFDEANLRLCGDSLEVLSQALKDLSDIAECKVEFAKGSKAEANEGSGEVIQSQEEQYQDQEQKLKQDQEQDHNLGENELTSAGLVNSYFGGRRLGGWGGQSASRKSIQAEAAHWLPLYTCSHDGDGDGDGDYGDLCEDVGYRYRNVGADWEACYDSDYSTSISTSADSSNSLDNSNSLDSVRSGAKKGECMAEGVEVGDGSRDSAAQAREEGLLSISKITATLLLGDDEDSHHVPTRSPLSRYGTEAGLEDDEEDEEGQELATLPSRGSLRSLHSNRDTLLLRGGYEEEEEEEEEEGYGLDQYNSDSDGEGDRKAQSFARARAKWMIPPERIEVLPLYVAVPSGLGGSDVTGSEALTVAERTQPLLKTLFVKGNVRLTLFLGLDLAASGQSGRRARQGDSISLQSKITTSVREYAPPNNSNKQHDQQEHERDEPAKSTHPIESVYSEAASCGDTGTGKSEEDRDIIKREESEGDYVQQRLAASCGDVLVLFHPAQQPAYRVLGAWKVRF